MENDQEYEKRERQAEMALVAMTYLVMLTATAFLTWECICIVGILIHD